MYKYRSTFAPPEYKTATEFRRERLANGWSHRLSSTTAARLGPELQKNLQPRVEVLGVHVARERRHLYGQDAQAAFEEIREFEPNSALKGQDDDDTAGSGVAGTKEHELGTKPDEENPRRRYKGAGRTRQATDAYFRHVLASYPESTLSLPIGGEVGHQVLPLTLEDLAATDRMRWAFLPERPPPPPPASGNSEMAGRRS